MRWIYISIFGWFLRIALAYIMFLALLNYAYFIAIVTMFMIYYVEFFEGVICRRMTQNKGKMT